MKRYVAIQSSTGDVYFLRADNAESAYVRLGRKVLGVEGKIDTGNVDFDLYEIPPLGDGPVQLAEL